MRACAFKTQSSGKGSRKSGACFLLHTLGERVHFSKAHPAVAEEDPPLVRGQRPSGGGGARVFLAGNNPPENSLGHMKQKKEQRGK